jgi:hypothetical protein
MDWMGLEKIVKKFDLFGIQTHLIPLNPHGLRANRTSPKKSCNQVFVFTYLTRTLWIIETAIPVITLCTQNLMDISIITHMSLEFTKGP